MKFSVYIAVLLIVVILIPFQVMGTASNEIPVENSSFKLIQKDPAAGYCSGQFVEAADPDWPFDVWINAGSSHYYYADSSEDTAMYGSFEIQSGVGIDFFICDQENFDLWTGGYAASVYEIHNNIGSLTWEFIVPYDDTWYIMYDNTDNLFDQAHAVGTHRLDRTGPTISINLDDGETYSGSQDVIVSTSDEGFGVYVITLFINDVITAYDFGSSLTYEWHTTGFDAGEYEIRVAAEDRAGNENSITLDVTVNNAPDLTIPILVVGCIALVGLGIGVSYVRKREPVVPHPETIPYSKQQEPAPLPVKQEETGFCTSCGSPRIPPDARFCAKCGAGFQN